MFDSKPVQSREEGIHRLLEANDIVVGPWNLTENSLILSNGKGVPLMPWRVHFHNLAMKDLIADKGLQNLSCLRILVSEEKKASLKQLMLKEMDMAEWLMQSNIISVFAMGNDSVLHVTMRLKNGVLCTMELNVVLPDGTKPVYKHELIAGTGYVTDRAVDTIVTPQKVYCCGDNETSTWNDVDVLTYGLTEKESSDARAAFEILAGHVDVDEQISSWKRLERLYAMVQKSKETNERIFIKEDEKA